MNPEKHPLQFRTPDLQTSPEVQESVEKQQRLNERALQNARELAQETGESIDSELFNVKIPNNPTERISVYMDRMEKIFLNPDPRVRTRNLKLLKPHLYDEYIIKPEEVPESYFALQQQVLREQGIEAQEIPEQMRKEMIETVIKDQKHSLDNWIDYLLSEDATYPTWFKYFVFQNITKLSQFDKNLGKFKDRTDTTVAPYPDVYREPLAQICDIYEQVAKDNKVLKADPSIQTQFSKSFPKLYAELITKSLAASMENKEEIKGEWIKYSKGNQEDADKLYKTLEGKGTGWCTAGKSTSEAQIKTGDFYVYYTYNQQGEPAQPRIAIRMNGTSTIGEVRGILQHQALEPQMKHIIKDKLSEFGSEADKYKKKSEDMEQMTLIEHKINKGESLTKSELEFLYEINTTIEGFGYQKDPRIGEIRDKRDIKEDIKTLYGYDLLNPNREALEFIYGVGKISAAKGFIQYVTKLRNERNIAEDIKTLYGYDLLNPDREALKFIYIHTPQVFFEYVTKLRKERSIEKDRQIFFECTQDQIATSLEQVDKNTKIYIGKWDINTYNVIKNFPKVTYLYESLNGEFLGEKLFKYDLKTNFFGLTKKNAKTRLQEKGVIIHQSLEPILNNIEFSIWSKKYKLVQFTVKQLGLSSGATTRDIYTKAEELGLKLCPAEVGPQLRLVYEGKDRQHIAMTPIREKNSNTYLNLWGIFTLETDTQNKKPMLEHTHSPVYGWSSNDKFVFLTD